MGVERVNRMSKAHDGVFAEAQAIRLEKERHTLNPGQVLTKAQQDEEWEKAMEAAKADLEKAKELKEKLLAAGKEDKPVCLSDDQPPDDSLGGLALGGLRYMPKSN